MASETLPDRAVCCGVPFHAVTGGALVHERHPDRPAMCRAHGSIAIENEERAAKAAKEKGR